MGGGKITALTSKRARSLPHPRGPTPKVDHGGGFLGRTPKTASPIQTDLGAQTHPMSERLGDSSWRVLNPIKGKANGTILTLRINQEFLSSSLLPACRSLISSFFNKIKDYSRKMFKKGGRRDRPTNPKCGTFYRTTLLGLLFYI